ncbi:hypothetical protein J437_LFUL016959, partial [Ladona fulva]
MPKLALTDMAVGCVTYCAVSSNPELSNCRLCFAKDSDVINIFEESGSSTNVVQTIYETLNYKVTKEDRFPPFICLDCLQKLKEFKDFKRKCDSRKQAYELILSARADNLKPVCTKVSRPRRNRIRASPEYLSPGQTPGSPVPPESPIAQASTLRRSRRPVSLRSLSYGEPPGSPVSQDGSESEDSEPELQDEIEENDKESEPELQNEIEDSVQVSRPKRNRRHASPKALSPGQHPGSKVPQEGPVSQESEPVLQNERQDDYQVTKRWRNRRHASQKSQSRGQPTKLAVPHDGPVIQEPEPKQQNEKKDYQVTKRRRNRRPASPKHQSPGNRPQDSAVVE